MFADTGLGKGWIALEWLRAIAEREDAPVLLVAPLAVSHQFAREAAKIGDTIHVVGDASEVKDGINVTNYQKLKRFDPSDFAAVALDESSILKSFTGHYRAELIEMFRETPYRLALTATPAPNDHMELGNHAEFLGAMTRVEMLSMFFVHDGETTQEWRLKGHAQQVFWKWVASWAVALRKPSDLGYDDAGYDLPPLIYKQHVIPADKDEILASGVLIAEEAKTLADQRAVRRSTVTRRVAKCAEIANGIGESPALVWCNLNDEGDALESAIPDAVQVAGVDSDDEKEHRIESFLDGKARVLVSKPTICGFGLNLQHCADVIFCGVTHSFEQFYQSIRRCWRFGQTRPVTVHVVTSEFEGRVVENLRRKQADAEKMTVAMVEAIGDLTKADLRGVTRLSVTYEPTKDMEVPSWLLAA